MSADLTCPCGTPLVRDGAVVCSHWTGAICWECERAAFAKHAARAPVVAPPPTPLDVGELDDAEGIASLPRDEQGFTRTQDEWDTLAAYAREQAEARGRAEQELENARASLVTQGDSMGRRIDAAEGELRTLDALMARITALDSYRSRAEKVSRMLRVLRAVNAPATIRPDGEVDRV